MVRKHIIPVMFAGLAVGVGASVAPAALNVEFLDDFDTFQTGYFGSGTGAGYVANGTWEVLHGFALYNSTLASNSVFHLGHTGGVGPGHPGGSSAGFDLVAFGDSSNLYGEGIYSAGFRQPRSRLVFAWQDMDNYYFVDIARQLNRSTFGLTHVGFGVRQGGVETWHGGWSSIGGVAEELGATPDVTDVTVTWEPGSQQVTIDLFWTNNEGTVVKFDSTVNVTEPGLWSSGRFGPYFGPFSNGQVDYVSFALIPEPASAGLLVLGSLAVLVRRRRM